MNTNLPYSLQTITALAEAVTGGSAGSSNPSIGLYRSASELVEFFGHLGMELYIGGGSRVPAVRELLINTNQGRNGRAEITKVIEACLDPRDYIDCPDKLKSVSEYLAKRLDFDKCALVQDDTKTTVANKIGTNSASLILKSKSILYDLSSVTADINRAESQAEIDPEDAITSACSTIESVCKCILDELALPYPKKQDISGLVNEVSKHLNLSPGRTDIEPDIKHILSGLISIANGIGALRTHASDAHGRGKKTSRVDSRIARLAIHAASTLALFYIETWQRNRQ